LASRLTPEKNQATPVWGGEVLQHIDWKQPWFQPWAEIGEPVSKEAADKKSVAQALNRHKRPKSNRHLESTTSHNPSPAVQRGWGAGLADLASEASMRPNSAPPSLNEASEGVEVEFVNQSELPPEQPYEAFIFQQKKVPTRDGLHDFFNGLCWQRFPTSKHRLNQLQAQEIAKQGIGSTRGAVRDSLTLFDENAVLWQGPDVLWQALQARDWFKLFVELRDQWQHVHLVLFGHALLEKLVTPYKSITGHVYRVSTDVPPHDDAALDAWVAQDLQTDKLATKPFEPLPVLGVPNWWVDNAAPAFYQDTQVFRPKRMPASQY
jgi:Protein of unknown function (DUF3025)